MNPEMYVLDLQNKHLRMRDVSNIPHYVTHYISSREW